MKSVKLAATLLLVIMSSFFFIQTASADPSAWPEWTCDTFPGTVEEAVTYFDEFGGPATLDADGDGIACNEDNIGGPSSWPEWTCDSFPGTVGEAIAYFETNGGPATLDANGDGIACNESNYGGPSAWPEWTCDTFPGTVDDAVAYFETNGGPVTLDADEDGIACNEDNGSDDDVTGDAEDASEPEVTLPNTGSGSHESTTAPFSILVGAAAVALLLAATTLRETRR